MFELTSYLGLFLAAFGAASLLPMQSEAVLVGMLLSGKYAALTLLAIATLGNVLGSVLNWLLGRSVERFRHKRWFPLSEQKLDRAQQFYRRYGRWSLLLSWMPIIGDPLTMIAGVMREPLWSFVLIVTLAKGTRYLRLTAATLGWSERTSLRGVKPALRRCGFPWPEGIQAARTGASADCTFERTRTGSARESAQAAQSAASVPAVAKPG